jgi:hypothetical protein
VTAPPSALRRASQAALLLGLAGALLGLVLHISLVLASWQPGGGLLALAWVPGHLLILLALAGFVLDTVRQPRDSS